MAGEFWYSVRGKRKGPVDIDAMRKLSVEGVVDGHTLVWREGMPKWASIDDTPELTGIRLALPPELPKPSAQEKATELVGANAWRRFFARSIDLWFFGVLVALGAGFVISQLSARLAILLQEQGAEYWFGWFLLPVTLFVEALVYGATGSTLGKGLLGIKVFSDSGKEATFGQYLSRQVGVYWYGLGTGFPFVSLFTMARQRSRLAKGGQPAYDQFKFDVKAPKLGLIRWFLIPCVLYLLVGASFFLEHLGKKALRPNANQELSSMAVPVAPQVWTNEFNGKTVTLPAGWIREEVTISEGEKLQIFKSPLPTVRVNIFRRSMGTTPNLIDYVKYFREQTSKEVKYDTGEIKSAQNGVKFWEGYGVIVERPSAVIAMYIAEKNGSAWHISLITEGKLAGAVGNEALGLQTALMSAL